ncbi:flagellar operon protein TIGR03826 [Peptoclostridium litorale DSM 5388]|uniref:Flagellar protein n=1 Tax=Peptoclostridium litorale DSM 5388 TaxID=1121324 RepID=A0A069RDB1_PEPLI|nr:hypothetical protein [Peptoclostridium litorale]KDR94753.1 hypothetical protein CLIT_13c00750 [Peptoclostridium litorale DSM 5388]SIN91932.1 flagellar operon protein TIGR03826 [Peptoclostridium litorale DSM 5388]
MELKNCISCGRTFGSEFGENLCKKCRNEAYENDFKKVREYLYDNPGSDVNEVSAATGVERTKIMLYLREERIEIIEDDNPFLKCSRCGKSIHKGKYCASCENELKKELSGALSSMKKEKSPEPEPSSSKKPAMHVDRFNKK